MINLPSFIVGALVSLIVSTVLLLGAWAVAQDTWKDVVLFWVGLGCGLLAMVILLTLLRKPLLRKLSVTTETRLTDVAETATKALGATVAGRQQEAVHQTGEFVRTGLAWYSTVSFYRWAIGSGIAIIVAFAGTAGSMLLFEQNKRIAEQTEQLKRQSALQSISLVADFRERLSAPPSPTVLGSVGNQKLWFPELGGSCQMLIKKKFNLYQRPNFSVVSALQKLSEEKEIAESVRSALSTLTVDQNPTVQIGALSALNRAKNTQLSVNIQRAVLDGFYIEGSHRVYIENSIIRSFACQGCELYIKNSIIQNINELLRANVQSSLVIFSSLLDKMFSASQNIDVENSIVYFDIPDRNLEPAVDGVPKYLLNDKNYYIYQSSGDSEGIKDVFLAPRFGASAENTREPGNQGCNHALRVMSFFLQKP